MRNQTVPRLCYAPGAGNAPVMPCLAGCARTRPVWRCSSSFASAGKPAYRESAGIAGTRAALECRRTAPPSRRDQKKGLKNVGRTQHHSKPKIVVVVVGLVPVANGTARVVPMVVPRTTAHDLSRLPDRVSPPGVTDDNRKVENRGEGSPAPPQEAEGRRFGDRSHRGQGFDAGAERNTTRNPRS